MKRLILLAFLLMSCSAGGEECPPMDETVYFTLDDGSIGMRVLKKGSLAQGEYIRKGIKGKYDAGGVNAVMSKEECAELLEEYKQKRIKELDG